MRHRAGPALAAAAALACGGAWPLAKRPSAPTRVVANLLANPGFEDGRAGWSQPVDNPYWGEFEVVESTARSGRRALRLSLEANRDADPGSGRIFGAMQELRPERFPDRVSGHYRVDAWEKGADTTKLFLQLVVIAWGDPATPRLVDPANPGSGIRNFQIRYLLGGVSEPPFPIANARFELVSRDLPARERWTYFEAPLRQDFARLWGRVPEGYEFLRVLFEARWHDKPAGSRIHAHVYYDDLFVGYADPS